MCKNNINGFPAGWNKDAICLLEAYKGIVITKSDVEVPLALAANKSAWLPFVQESLSAVYYDFNDYEPTIEDPEVEEDAYKRRKTTRTFAPSMTAYVHLGTCDWRELLSTFRGGSYRIYGVMENGALHGFQSGTNFKPFSATIQAVNRGIPVAGELMKFNRLDIYFQDLDEFDMFTTVQPNFNVSSTFKMEMPTGYNLTVNSYNGTVATATTNVRCGDFIDVFDETADWEVVNTNSSASITAVSVAGNVYSISIALASGEYADIRLKKLNGSVVTDVSGTVRIEA